MQNQNEEDKVNESQPGNGKEIVFLKSFEEMNDYDHRQMAMHTPVERLQNITSLLMERYVVELKQNQMDLTLHFK
jgi:hypothetical protein